MKPGWKTTEWWISVIVALDGLALSSGLLPEGSAGMRIAGLVAAALGAVGYSVSRGIAKKGA